MCVENPRWAFCSVAWISAEDFPQRRVQLYFVDARIEARARVDLPAEWEALRPRRPEGLAYGVMAAWSPPATPGSNWPSGAWIALSVI